MTLIGIESSTHKITNGPRAPEKVFKPISQQENADQHHNDATSHPPGWPGATSPRIGPGQDAGTMEPSGPAGGKGDGQLLWKTAWRFLKGETELPCAPAVPPVGIFPREMKTHALPKTHPAVSIAARSTAARGVGTAHVPLSGHPDKENMIYSSRGIRF